MDRPARKLVVIGLVGPTLDASYGDAWSRWRPTVSIGQHEDLLVDRLELLHGARHRELAETVAEDFASVSPESTVQLHRISLQDPWDFEEVYPTLHQFARDYPFDLEREEYLVHITTGTHVSQICLFLLTESRHLPGRLLQTSPPSKRKERPSGRYQIIDLDLSRYDPIALRHTVEREEGVSLLKSGIATRNAAFNRTIEELERVALASEAPILLLGPTGAGKSQLAARIYDLRKKRRKLEGPLVEVNCATLRGDAAMSTLFGHRRGAFTGAVSDRAGLLKAAEGGVLFLDEIGELGLDEQAMLLRALEEKRFLPLGSDEEVEGRFQLVAGSNLDLQERVAEGRFREDLLTRIHLWTFRLPGLRDRPEDLEPNLDYELAQFTARHGTRVHFNKEARAQYLAFARSSEARWSGSFRDLNASVTRMATLARAGRIRQAEVRRELERLRHDWREVDQENRPVDLGRWLGSEELEALDLFDRVQLEEVVRVCQRSRTLSEAGRALFAASRKRKQNPNDADRLRKYLARHALDFDELRAPLSASAR